MLLAVALVAAPCALVGTDAFAAGKQAAHHAPVETMHGDAMLAHCGGSPDGVAEECVTKCHSWNIPSLTSVETPRSPQAVPDAAQMFALTGAVDGARRHLATPVGGRADGLLLAGAVYAKTSRYRL